MQVVPGGALRRRVAVAAALAVVALLSSFGRAGASPESARIVLVTFPCDRTNFLCPAFVQALRRTGVQGRVVAPDPREDRASSLSLLARQGYRTIVVDGSFSDVLGSVATRFPDVRFALVDGDLLPASRRLRNVTRVIIRTHEASYLAGWLAAKLELGRPGRDVVGVVGGAPFPPVDDFVVGFRAGARASAPGITVLVGYSEDFADPKKCRAIARSQIARGAGTVFNVAGACGLGTLDAARNGRVWGIGVDFDQSSLGRHILTSVVKRYDVVFEAIIRQGREHQARPGQTLAFGLRHDAARLGRISAEVSKPLRAALDVVRRRIANGQIRVPGCPHAPVHSTC